MVDVIISENTRPASGCLPLTYYSAGGVFLALEQKGLDVRWVDIAADRSIGPFREICCFAIFFALVCACSVPRAQRATIGSRSCHARWRR